MLLLSGPTAAGKNTIGKEIAYRRERCAVIDFDLVRIMFANPHKAPWDGDEGLVQQKMGLHMVCDLAERFEAAGWDVIILDVLSMTTLAMYRERLNNPLLKIVQLLPSYDIVLKRFNERGPVLTYEELENVYREQTQLTGYDLRIDNSHLSAKVVAQQLLEFWKPYNWSNDL